MIEVSRRGALVTAVALGALAKGGAAAAAFAQQAADAGAAWDLTDLYPSAAVREGLVGG